MNGNEASRMPLAVLVYAFVLGCGAEEVAVSPDLVGAWHSAKAGYEENSMEFEKDVVIFRAADNHYTVHPVKAFKGTRQEKSERTRYELVYTNLGEALHTVLYLADDGELVFENQRGVAWRRDLRAP